MSKGTILLVEDNSKNVEFMVDYLLVPNDYEPMVATDGRQGLAMALTGKPDLIILDFKLPGLSGIQVLEALREKKIDTPVIFITAYGSEEDVISCFRLGIKDYFRKPFDADQMLVTIEQALAETRQQNQRNDQRQKLEEYIKELGTLYGSSLERVLNRIVEIAVSLSHAEEGYLLLVDRQTNELYMRSALNLGERFAREFRIRIQDSITGRVVQTGKPAMYNSLEASDRFKVKTGYLVRALINVPLRSNGKVIGVLGVDNKLSARTFTHADQDLLCLLADHAATTIENASLYGQTHKDLIRQVKEFLIIQDVARDLNAIMDMEHIARLVLRYAVRMAPAEAGLIGLMTHTHGTRVSWTPHGYIIPLVETGSWQPRWDKGLIGQATSSGRAQLVSGRIRMRGHPAGERSVSDALTTDSPSGYETEADATSVDGQSVDIPSADPLPAHDMPASDKADEALALHSRSRLVVPILRGGRVLGIIDLESTKPGAFSENDRRLLSILADHAAVAIENTQLFDMVLDEQNKTKFILQSIAEGVYTVDCDLRIRTFNPAAERITGWREDEVRGKLCSEVFCDATPGPNGESSSHQAALIRRALREGKHVTSGQDAPPILTRDRREAFIASSASPLQNRESIVVGSVIAFRDVSVERELDQLKSDFVSMVSHELRSPLASLSAAIELMLQADAVHQPDAGHRREAADRPDRTDDSVGTTHQALQIARANAQRLTRLIENILSVSQIEANQIRVQPEPTLLVPVIQSVIQTVQAQTTRHQIVLRTPKSVPVVLADQNKLEIVLHNLLTNAVHYSPDGGRILVRVASGYRLSATVRNELVVSVIDDGIGISQENQDKLFTRFYRADSSDGRDVYGHGLGLYISKHLIELQNGRIWVQSREGHGSCFSFTVPIVTEPEQGIYAEAEDQEFLAPLED